ncbi:MAG: cytochrome c-552 precursor [Alphaproteobacteria bacterium]|nr:cytochrome c-552 precursor [Alphaproteobacteria bacterium]
MKTLAVAALLGAAAIYAPNAYAADIDWAAVPGKDVTLFYPGQTSWEYILTPTKHEGAPRFKGGKNCVECHTGEEDLLGKKLVTGKINEPTPIPDKPGFLPANIKFAHDATTLYVHLEFADGGQPDAKMDPKYETKVTMMLNQGTLPEAVRAGCWGGCHEDLATMPAADGAERTMYTAGTRAKMSAQGGGDALKPEADLTKLRAEGKTFEYWQARLNAGAPAVAVDGTIFDKRVENPTPAVTAEATLAGGKWSVTLSRKLKAGAPYKDLEAGHTYTVGFAIHAGHTARRFHYVSMARTFVVDQQNLVADKVPADFTAAGK